MIKVLATWHSTWHEKMTLEVSMIVHHGILLTIWKIQKMLILLNTYHEPAWSTCHINHWHVFMHFVEWSLTLGYISWLHRRNEMIVELVLIGSFKHLRVLHILYLRKTVIVGLLCCVATWITGLLLHQLNYFILLLRVVTLVLLNVGCLVLLLVSLWDQESIFCGQIWISHIMVGLSILLHWGHVCMTIINKVVVESNVPKIWCLGIHHSLWSLERRVI